MPVKNLQEEKQTEKQSLMDYAPGEYSFRDTLGTTVKLLAIGGGVFALLWVLDRFVAQ